MAINNLSDEELIEYYNMFKKGVDKTSRFETRKENNTDLKFLYHLVRLLSECEMILAEGTLDLRRNREQLKAIRRGDMDEEAIREWAAAKEGQLEELFHKSKLPEKPDELKIKALLLSCLEHHYGNLKDCVVNPDAALVALRQVQEILESCKGLIYSNE